MNKTNGFAIAGFVCSIASIFVFGWICSILGIVFGGIGLNNANYKGYGGKSLAIASIVIGYICFAVMVIKLMIASSLMI